MLNKTTLLAQSDLLFLLAQLFSLPIAKISLTQLSFDELVQQTELAEINKINQLYQIIANQMGIIPLTDWQEEYNFLFEGNVACAINETGYVRRDKGAILADISGFYRAFQIQLSDSATEKADHLVAELEFMALLLVMLAKAETEETKTITYDALAAFCFDHMSEWIPLFCQRLTKTSQLYTHLAEFLQTVWSGIVEANHLPVAELSPQQDIPITEDTETPYECDMVETIK